ncbi:MAG: hypothetical protein PHQ66_02075 [Candidatus Nanoarchaeia archaeon]|nr:hypothetical protein [Candidatus Nanoarchaeia archaeon]MDD5357840.1 hypothetical protein [Candidatus Nanoarchaeia archaeon]MDD5588759.1 hypothetical protein [Candidatus Nanoarchaeia archaeon]
MIFNLELIKTKDAERVIFNIFSMYPRCIGGIFTILDTGSPRTIISAADAFRLKIPVNGLEDSRPACGFGRGGIPCKILHNFKFNIKSPDNKTRLVEMPVHVVDITALKKMNKDLIDNAFKVPSVIGIDFLRSQKLKMIVDFENDSSSYLEELK